MLPRRTAAVGLRRGRMRFKYNCTMPRYNSASTVPLLDAAMGMHMEAPSCHSVDTSTTTQRDVRAEGSALNRKAYIAVTRPQDMVYSTVQAITLHAHSSNGRSIFPLGRMRNSPGSWVAKHSPADT